MSTSAQQIAQGLAWFGIGLGIVELLAPRKVAAATGLDGHDQIIRAFGAREIAAGVMVLSTRNPERWLWTRVAGDGLDAALLGKGLSRSNPRRGRTLAAALAVAPIVILDCLIAGRA